MSETVCPCCGEPVKMDPTPIQLALARAIARNNPRIQFMCSGAVYDDPDLWLTGDDGNELTVLPDGTAVGYEAREAWGVRRLEVDAEIRRRALGEDLPKEKR